MQILLIYTKDETTDYTSFLEKINKIDNIHCDAIEIQGQKYLNLTKRKVKEEKDNYTIYTYPILLNPNEKVFIVNYVKVLKKALKEYQKDHKIDIMHAINTMPAGYAASLLGKELKISTLVQEKKQNYQIYFTNNNEQIGRVILNNSYFTVTNEDLVNKIADITNNVSFLEDLKTIDIPKLIAIYKKIR